MAEVPTITVDWDRKCRKCGKRGATEYGLCMRCIARHVQKMPRPEKPKKAKERSDGLADQS